MHSLPLRACESDRVEGPLELPYSLVFEQGAEPMRAGEAEGNETVTWHGPLLRWRRVR